MSIILKHFNKDNEKYTLNKFIDFINNQDNQNKTFELISGYIYMLAGNATPNHQRICGYIARIIGNHLDGKQCEVFQDLNTYLFKDDFGKCENVYQPDVIINCDKTKITTKGCEGSPDFICEVISKSTANVDYFIKLNYYMAFGVKEYWIVDKNKDQITVYLNGGDDESPTIFRYSFDSVVKIHIFDDLYIDFNNIIKILD